MPDWQNLMIIGGGVLAGTGFIILYTRVQNLSKGIIVLLAAIIAVGVGFVGAGVAGNVLAEDNDLMSRLGWEPRGFIVTSVDSEEVCAVLTGDDDVTCLDRERIFNDGQENFGAPAVTLIPGERLSATRLKVFGEEGVLFNISR